MTLSSGKAQRSVYVGLVAALLLAAILIARHWSRGQLAAYAGLVVVFLALSAAAARFKTNDRAVLELLSGLFSFCSATLVALAPAWASSWLSDLLLQRLPSALQAAVFLAWGALLAAALLAIATERRRDWLFDALSRFGPFAPLAYSLGVLFFAILFFSSMTFVLARSGAVQFAGAAGMPAPGRISDFYLWHFLNAVPVLDVTKTLRWDEPLTYADRRVGWLLLAFKIAVIVPVVAAFTGYWSQAGRQLRSGSDRDRSRQDSRAGAT